MHTRNEPEVITFADRLANLKEAYKADVSSVMADAEEAQIDTAGLRRLVTWRGKDALKRAEQEAIDDQYRFLAGDRPVPAELPPDCELAKAIALYRADHTVRQVAEILDVSTGKAQKLRTLAKAFDVHFQVNVNKMNAARDMVEDDLGHWLPPHDAATGEIHETALDTPPLREREFEVASRPCNIMPAPEAWHGITRAFIEAEERRRVEREAAKERRRAEREALAARNRRIDADDLAIPDFLRRKPAEVVA